MTGYRAAWVCPVDGPPLPDGWVSVAGGRIAGLGSGVAPVATHDLGRVALLPGLVNAHLHLELSWLRGRVPPAPSFTSWVRRLMATRQGVERPDDPGVIAAIDAAIGELRRSGTVAVGDISNSLASVGPVRRAGLGGVVFHELLGFQVRDDAPVRASAALQDAARGEGVRLSTAAHAPYSTSPELFTAIRAHVDASACRVTSVHLGESVEELELLATGGGPWRGMLEAIGAWRDDWAVPGRGPVGYLDSLGFIDAGTLVVHGVQFADEELARLASLGATLVTCPRSNEWVGAGAPPVGRFYASGVAVAVGTDSLASVDDLNLFSELHAMRRLAPEVPARRLLESATLVGARALGLEAGLGTLSPGKQALMVAVALPETVDDVEEYLVSGVDPSRIELLTPAS